MRALWLGLVLTVSAGMLGGCEQEGPAERAGEQVDETFERAGEELDQAVERAGETLEEAGDRIEEHTR